MNFKRIDKIIDEFYDVNEGISGLEDKLYDFDPERLTRSDLIELGNYVMRTHGFLVAINKEVNIMKHRRIRTRLANWFWK